jgi:hypothetical protein
MAHKFRVDVFGKQGCEKCGVLNQRLDKLLENPDWAAFQKHYWDVETENGMVAFAEAEVLNPQRIPAMLVMRQVADGGEFEPVPSPFSAEEHPVLKGAALLGYLGLQTDYAASGVISPKMISACLEAAVGA